MIELPRPRRGDLQEARSQVLLELCLNLYALIGALIVVRVLLLSLGVDRGVWIGAATYRLTNLVAWPLGVLPGGDTRMVGSATLADFTLLALVVMIPLGILARGDARRAHRLRP